MDDNTRRRLAALGLSAPDLQPPPPSDDDVLPIPREQIIAEGVEMGIINPDTDAAECSLDDLIGMYTLIAAMKARPSAFRVVTDIG